MRLRGRRLRLSIASLGSIGALLIPGSALSAAHAAPNHLKPPSQTGLVGPHIIANLCSSNGVSSGRTVAGALRGDDLHRSLSTDAEGMRPRRDAPGTAARLAGNIHPSAGTTFKNIAGSDGTCATQSVALNVDVTEGSTWIYTPTLYPAGGSCIEVTTAYTNYQNVVWAWDWCRSTAVATRVSIDARFLATYTDGRDPSYTVRIVRTSSTSNTWTSEFYNHKTAKWDELFTQSGRSRGPAYGWDQNEIYSSTDGSGNARSCSVMRGVNFESKNISLRTNGRWQPANPQNSSTWLDQPNSAYRCPTRSYHMVNKYDHWKTVG